jgi:hypothetical protein
LRGCAPLKLPAYAGYLLALPPQLRPYFNLANSIKHIRANEIVFHRIIGHNLKKMPYASQQTEPNKKSSVKERLISRALLSANRRHTCGIIPSVINKPPPNPRSSCQVKVHLLPRLYLLDCQVGSSYTQLLLKRRV